MKILFITRKFPPSIGGMQKFSYDLYQSLAKKEKLRLIAWGKSQKWLPVILPLICIKSVYQCFKFKPDLVLLADGVLSPLGMILKKLFRVKVAITILGKDIIYKNLLYQKLIPCSIRYLDKIVCVSNSTLKECNARGVPYNKCMLIPIGIQPNEYHSNKTKSESRKKLSSVIQLDLSNKFILLTVGRLVKRKGHSWFIQNVMPLLLSNVVYLIAGDGPEKSSIKELIREKKLTDKVFLLGEVSNEQKNILYQAADLLVMPNIKVGGDIEGFGIVAIEASSNGLPVVASNIEGLKDAIINGENGFLVNSENPKAFTEKINWIMKPCFNRKSWKIKAKKFTEKNYNWSVIANLYSKEFLRMIRE